MTATSGWESYLEPGEQILWQGRPGGALRFRRKPAGRLLFSFFWLGFSLFWVAGAAQASVFFALFGLPFVAIGIYMVGGDMLWEAFLRRHSVYSLSNKRAFIASEAFGRRALRTYPITATTPVEFEDSDPPSIWFAENQIGTERKRIGFEFIQDGHDVYRLIRDVKRGQA